MAANGVETPVETHSDTRRRALLRLGATRGAVVGWLVVLIAAVSGAAALGDNSFLTHLTTGRLILDGHFPRADPYSFTAHGEPWVVQSWLASVLYAMTDKIGHGAGIRAMVAVLSGVLAAILWRLTRPARSVVARLAAVAPAIIVGTVTWGHRPLLFGLLGFSLVLLVLVEERDPRWLVPVMWVWVNTHGSFPLGIVLIVVYGFGVWCDKGSLTHSLRTLEWVVIGVVVGAINPIGPKLLWFPVELLRKQDVLGFMVEWQAPSFTSLWQRIFLVAFVVGMALVPRLGVERRYRVLLPALVFTALGFTASRNIALATFLLTVLLAYGLAGIGSLASRVRSRGYTVGCAVLAVLTVVIVSVRLSQPSFDLSGYPVAAVDWLDAQGRLGPASRVATNDLVGNYIEFRFEGATPVFVDDRVDMYPPTFVDDAKQLMDARGSWAEILDRYGVDTVLWRDDTPLSSVLAASSDWRSAKVFEDPDEGSTWVVYERVNARQG